ncbi:hypothetical protein [Duganella dendranthematis]|uniref:hypothetical protein n=1 Tax=Duganella dendranthematis TaxID=2728021 RepID=UPI001E4BD259|nr:hypothetical protein [Duganella dendranthematis]
MSQEKPIIEVSTYSKDTPIGRPDTDGRAAVFVPSEAFDAGNNAAIRMGSGIVGFGNPDGTLTVYFEANRFDETSLHKWENKARKAYDRMVMGAPPSPRPRSAPACWNRLASSMAWAFT